MSAEFDDAPESHSTLVGDAVHGVVRVWCVGMSAERPMGRFFAAVRQKEATAFSDG